jgi:hypothetical protein
MDSRSTVALLHGMQVQLPAAWQRPRQRLLEGKALHVAQCPRPWLLVRGQPDALQCAAVALEQQRCLRLAHAGRVPADANAHRLQAGGEEGLEARHVGQAAQLHIWQPAVQAQELQLAWLGRWG